MDTMDNLPIIQRMYDLILWYVPRLNKMPRNYKHLLGDRIQTQLYSVLEGFIRARYRREKLPLLEELTVDPDIIRFQTQLCKDFSLLDTRRYEHVSKMTNEIGENLGGWIRQQRKKKQ